ncbi:expressed unknown protein [Ectocarpus siliculosus]|uniref:Uncharacterized protein n=1 Tax=Ectocarpus siliculosus TaxID=2880 RepID=D7FU87_ECTSI|nr:expressed unknown protein [Ectocarpus siliculosus]|eukprot:CBJ31614.1 expressed unknown protein [Ectocarpus siliculosus]
MTATTAFIELPRAEEAEQEEARMKGGVGSDESGGRGWGADGKQGSRKAGVSAGAGPGEEGVAAGARAQEAKQGSRRPGQQDDTVSDHDSSGQGITVIAACIGALVVFSMVWCWLSSVFVCVSWCVCKCARPNSRHSSSSCTENKHVDTYAGAVRATFCGTLASVVCVSDGGTAGKNDTNGQEDGFPASLPCTPQPGSSIGSTSSSENLVDEAAAVTHAGVTADAPPAAIKGAAPVNIDGGAASSYSAFSGMFRRALTATALPPDTPTAHGSPSAGHGAQLRQQQHGLDGNGGDGSSDQNPLALCPTGDGGGSSGDIALVWGEEKQSENGSHTTTDAARPRGRPFLRSSGGASDRTPWTHRFWARSSGDSCRHEAGRRWGTGGGPASGVSNGSPERSSGENGSPEGSLGEAAAFEGHHGLFDALSHRRREAHRARLAGGSRAQERGRGGDGHLTSAAAAAEPDSGGGNNSRSRGNAAGCVVGATADQQVSPEPAVLATPAPPETAAGSALRSSSSTNNNDGGGREVTAAGGGAAAEISRVERGCPPRGGGVAEDAGNGDEERGEDRGSFPPGDTESIPPGLPRARMLWRAFSEVDHNKIEDNHRRAAQRHLARFGPAPGVRNPPMCYGPM